MLADLPAARRSSPMTIPNILTLFRLVLIPFFVAAALSARFGMAFVLFVVAGLSDAIDGFVARRFNQKSRLGALLDPAADKLLMFSGYIVFTFSDVVRHTLPLWLMFAIFIRDLLIVVFAYLLYTRVDLRRFPPSFAGKLATVFQVVTLATTIAANTRLAPVALPLLPWLFRVTLVVTLYSSFDYMRRGESAFLRQWTLLAASHEDEREERNAEGGRPVV